MSMAIFYSNCHYIQVAFCSNSMPASVIFAFLGIAILVGVRCYLTVVLIYIFLISKTVHETLNLVICVPSFKKYLNRF